MNVKLKGTKEEIANALEIRKKILPLIEQALVIVEENGRSERADQKFLEVNARTSRLLKHMDKVADASFWIENFASLNRYIEQIEGALENAKAANEVDAVELFTEYLGRTPRDLAQRMWDRSRQEPDEIEEVIKKAQGR